MGPRARIAILLLAAFAAAGCKGRKPNVPLVPLAFAGDPYGPDGALEKDSWASAFDEASLHVVRADGTRMVLETWREDGEAEPAVDVAEIAEASWGEPPSCEGEGPTHVERRISIFPEGLARVEGAGWALAMGATTEYVCPGGAKHETSVDLLLAMDGAWTAGGGPLALRQGEPATARVVLGMPGGPVVAWATPAEAGLSSRAGSVPMDVEGCDLGFPPIFEPAGGLVAVITRRGSDMRVRLVDPATGNASADVALGAPAEPLSIATAWAGDRLGVFFALDKAVGTGSLLNHVLVEVFPDGTVGQPINVYAQRSVADDPAFTHHLEAVAADGMYGLAWIEDDGFSQDLFVDEVLVGGEATDEMAWTLDLGDGYRDVRDLAFYSTPPQYVILVIGRAGVAARLTALPTDR